MPTFAITTTQSAADTLQQLATLIEDPTGDVTVLVTIGSGIVHREPAKGYTWNGEKYHPGCLVDVMIWRRELSPGARGMTPTEALRQRAAATGDQDVFHIEPTSNTAQCSGCTSPWVSE